MVHTIEHRRFALGTLQEAPPHWAVVTVKCCIVGILLLPVTTLLWMLVYQPTEEADLGPIAFVVTIGLGLVMYAGAAFLTGTYPPVPPTKKP
jgi:hypothetical protein